MSSEFPGGGATSPTWSEDKEQEVKQLLEPIVEYFKATKEKPDDDLKAQLKKLISLSGVCRPPTPGLGSKKEKKKPQSADQDRAVRFLGECCICGLEKRGNYCRLGFLCAGCRVVPLKQVQTLASTRVPRVRYSPHYVPSLLYPRAFGFLPEYNFNGSIQIGEYEAGGGGMSSNNAIVVPGGVVDEDARSKPPRYSVFCQDVAPRHEAQIFSAVDTIRTLYHPSFLHNFSISRDVQRKKIWIAHETANPIELRGALLSGQRCYELLRQIAVAALSGLLFLRDFGRTHNDLRPQNFFIDDRHRVKLRLAPFPAEDLPAPFSYQNSFFSVSPDLRNNNNAESTEVSGSSFASGPRSGALPAPSANGTESPIPGDLSGGADTPSAISPNVSQRSLQKDTSFASKIDSYCLARRTSRRRDHTDESSSRDMFVLGVTLTLIAYGDVDNLPLPDSDDVGSDPDELFLVEFIWRLLTGERSPDEALRDDYLTTVRLVDGAAVETIVLRVVAPPIPADVQEQLTIAESLNSPPSPKREKKLTFRESEDEKKAKEDAKTKNKVTDEFIQALNAASLRFRVNRWTPAVAKLVAFFNNSEVPAGEEHITGAADPHLFQVVRTPTQLTFYSVRRDPRLLRARQIATERNIGYMSFNNALMASSSMTLTARPNVSGHFSMPKEISP